jgi:hypothetical protein
LVCLNYLSPPAAYGSRVAKQPEHLKIVVASAA